MCRFFPLHISVLIIAALSCEDGVHEGENGIPDNVIVDKGYSRSHYFFLDMQFRAYYYPLHESGSHIYNPNRVVVQLELYRYSQETAETVFGTACVDPHNPGYFSEYTQIGYFYRLVSGEDYTFDPYSGWIRLASPASAWDIIAAAYALGDTNNNISEVVGDVDFSSADTLRLKLIKDRGPPDYHPTLPLEFKNVYYLGRDNINPKDLDIIIVDSLSTIGDGDRYTDGTNYLTIFGLDQHDTHGQPVPDELIDIDNPNIVDLRLGELHFPSLLPFTYSSIPGLGTDHLALKEIYGYEIEDPNQNFIFDEGEDLNASGEWDVPAMYYRYQDRAQVDLESRFAIHVFQH
ncbi:MAG: hypothetical protein JSW54_13660 [Fidelibacterota bacterium]|nr:MAG: hypothetical protein JSW54_13660 [Candidatus Neomarinimicrobiota bacterium]